MLCFGSNQWSNKMTDCIVPLKEKRLKHSPGLGFYHSPVGEYVLWKDNVEAVEGLKLDIERLRQKGDIIVTEDIYYNMALTRCKEKIEEWFGK
jgi:hypothetical protein